MPAPSGAVTFLFSDVEDSTRLWEQEPERMQAALGAHDAVSREAVTSNGGSVVKMVGDGLHAAFDDPADAIRAALALQLALASLQATGGLELRVRCGIHVGDEQRRDGDFYGRSVNRAARITNAAYGGQVLVSRAVANLVSAQLPAEASLRDLGSVRLRGLDSPEQVFQLVHPKLRAEFPALRTLAETPHNLRPELTSFVGRGRELGEITRKLRESRLVTLTGMGGMGKTRLSLRLAFESLPHFPDGAFFVDLAPIVDERLVAQAVATAVGVREDAGQSVVEVLERFVRDRRVLIVLDNCEHVIEACATVAEKLLLAGRDAKILATSREPLRIGGEVTYAVPALAVPEAEAVAEGGALARFPSIQLFLERATAAKPGFTLTPGNTRAVIEICRRLDGIPLAIELAVARIRELSVEAIAQRLDDRFRLLNKGNRTALARQQTLRALIDWSYDLLTADERALLRRLSVFAGSWDLEAAEAVGGGPVLDTLGSLVEKSLVARDDDTGRYRLLETVRLYALDGLVLAGEGEATTARHHAHFLTLAERANPQLMGDAQGEWLARLDLERENFLAAQAWRDKAPGAGERALRLANALKLYWLSRGFLGLGLQFTVAALERQEARTRDSARARALFNAGQLGCFMRRYAEAAKHLDESLAIAREIGDRGRVEAVLEMLGMAALAGGDLAAAQRLYEEALAIARQLDNPRQVASALNALAQCRRAAGALDEAEPLYEQVVALARESGQRQVVAVGLLNLAQVAIDRSRFDQVRGMLREVHAIAVETGSVPAGLSLIEVCSGLAAATGDWERAARFFGAAEVQVDRSGIHRDASDEAFLAALVAKARAAAGPEAFSASESAGRALSYDEALAEALASID